jgi:hypothetical protein
MRFNAFVDSRHDGFRSVSDRFVDPVPVFMKRMSKLYAIPRDSILQG